MMGSCGRRAGEVSIQANTKSPDIAVAPIPTNRMMATTLLSLGALYFFAHALVVAFKRTRVPDVLVLMLVGIVAGPLLHAVEPESFGQMGRVLTTIALAAILFESGTTLDLRQVTRSAGDATSLALISAGVTIALVAPLAVAVADLSWIAAFTLGVIVCGTSSAVVIPMVGALSMEDEPSTLLILESALTDVLCIVIVFGLIQASQQGNVEVGRVIGQTIAALVFAAIIGIAGGLAWLRIWNWVRTLPATNFSTIAWALVLYGLAEFLGFSGAIAVLSFGLTLRNHKAMRLHKWFDNSMFSGVTDTEQKFYQEIVFLLKTFFFVYLGLSMRMEGWQGVAVALGLVVVVYAARLLIARYRLPTHYTRRDAAIVSVMVPKGLAAAVLAGLPLQAGMAGGEAIQSIVFAMVFMSITLTALVIAFMDTAPMRAGLARVFAPFGSGVAADKAKGAA
jgi:NhaP-type Na+/H+ or K+/H+ antiporter